MNTYLDVGAVRVQAYLTRSHRLRARTGGSSHIAEVSGEYRTPAGAQALTDLLGADHAWWQFNDEAGAVDGVVSLRHPGQLTDQQVRPIGTRVLHRLRQRWPGADLHAVWGTGASYPQAYQRELAPRLRRHEVSYAWPPVPELPLARPCQWCEQDAAVSSHRVVRENRELCPDCLARGVPRPTGQVSLERLVGDDNHLGTVFMDGNAVGALFAGLAGAGPAAPVGLSARLSAALTDATHAALGDATEKVRLHGDPADPDQRRLVHVAGGDDVLVSLPARRAWPFTRQLLKSFHDQVAAALARLLDVTDDQLLPALSEATGGAVTRLPSASAGLVIARYEIPMAVCVGLAGERLREAKRAAAGDQASIAWTDYTIDGAHPPPWRQPWLLSELEQSEGRLAAVAGLPQSARQAAARLLDPDRPVVSWCRLSVHLDRLDRDHGTRRALEPFQREPIGAADPAVAVARTLDALTIARWWA